MTLGASSLLVVKMPSLPYPSSVPYLRAGILALSGSFFPWRTGSASLWAWHWGPSLEHPLCKAMEPPGILGWALPLGSYPQSLGVVRVPLV